MEITEAGKVVYNHCCRILATIKESLVEVQALTKDLRGNVIGCQHNSWRIYFAYGSWQFSKISSQLNVKLEIADSTEIARMVTDGVIEAGVIGAVINNPALKQELIYQDELVIIAPKGHPLTEKKMSRRGRS